ncbi:MAG: GTPase Era [Gammaproteobacteria bacterium]|nr:GTPase Era [Gammaproteobacteria bacterium]MDH5777200.1 GTPase Era [Gammaproteobacteria bacterium]
MNKESDFRCGYIGLIGRPNVGKSTLLNHLIGQKISITSHKPQTTRHRILGIKTTETTQFVFVDTPGLHKAGKQAMSRYLNRAASSTLSDVDVVVFIIEALSFTDEDAQVLDKVKTLNVPVILAINKVDRITEKERLLPFLAEMGSKMNFAEVLPVSALKDINLKEIEASIQKLLPENAPFYDEDQITDRSVRFLAAEIIREKLTRTLHQELPYNLTVEIEQFKHGEEQTLINAIIWVERDNQKGIVIGKNGERLKEIGKQSRLDISKLIERRVHLELWVKVKEGWSDDERSLHSLGYRDEL